MVEQPQSIDKLTEEQIIDMARQILLKTGNHRILRNLISDTKNPYGIEWQLFHGNEFNIFGSYISPEFDQMPEKNIEELSLNPPELTSLTIRGIPDPLYFRFDKHSSLLEYRRDDWVHRFIKLHEFIISSNDTQNARH